MYGGVLGLCGVSNGSPSPSKLGFHKYGDSPCAVASLGLGFVSRCGARSDAARDLATLLLLGRGLVACAEDCPSPRATLWRRAVSDRVDCRCCRCGAAVLLGLVASGNMGEVMASC